MFSIFQFTNINYSIHSIIFCFFLYKLSETILQYGTRIEIYQIICRIWINSTKLQQKLCFNDKKHSIDYNDNDNFNDTINNANELLIKIQQTSAYYLLIYRILLNAPAIITCLIYGSYSNKYGCKLSMLIPCIGAIIACTLFIYNSILFSDTTTTTNTINTTNNEYIYLSIIYILIGGLIYGICGKSNAITMSINSYGLNYLGLSLGTLLFGIFLTYLTYTQSMIFCIINNFLIILIVLFLIIDIKINNNETILILSNKQINNHNNNQSYRLKIKNLQEQFNQSYKFLYKNKLNEKYKLFIILLITILCNQMIKSGEQDIILLYLRNEPTLWTSELYGYYLACYYGCMFLHLIIILPIINYYYYDNNTINDTTLILFGITMKIIRLILMCIMNYTNWLFIGAIIGSASGYITSSIRSIISKLMQKSEINASFAFISILEIISNLFGNLLFTLIYNYTINYMKSFTLLFDALLHCCILVVFIWIRYKLITIEKVNEQEEEEQ
ncbi:Proton-coupled folate transporter [Schistosoma japonicum]|nr:Proton-coupled folate transporter [Schistosoma japonicum]